MILSSVLHNIGKCKLALKDEHAASQALLKCVSIQSDYVDAHIALAKISLQTNDFEAANMHLRQARSLPITTPEFIG